MNEDCPIHCVEQSDCPHCMQNDPYCIHHDRRIDHDRRWTKLMIVAIAMGTTMPFPVNVLQITTCGWMLLWKLDRLYRRQP